MGANNSFLTVGLTLPSVSNDFVQEALCITEFLRSGAIDLFHIRKPDADLKYTDNLISQIPQNLHGRLILHSHFPLYKKYRFGGFHHKRESDFLFMDRDIQPQIMTRSCHSIDECESHPELYSYSFLSPIFDSISKPNYLSNFSLNPSVFPKHFGDHPVVALGGIIPEVFAKLFNLKFAGAALLGYLWTPKSSVSTKIYEITNSLKLIENLKP